jgi:hypothetical protein
MMKVTLPDDIERKLNLASAAVGLSVREYVAACLIAGLETHSQHDGTLAMVFQGLDKLAA